MSSWLFRGLCIVVFPPTGTGPPHSCWDCETSSQLVPDSATVFWCPVLRCSLSVASAVAMMVLCWVFVAVLVLVSAFVFLKSCKLAFFTYPCKESKIGRISELSVEKQKSSVSLQVLSLCGAAAMEPGNLKFLHAAAASCQTIASVFEQ